MENNLFISTDQFGDLIIYDVLLFYLYPRVFVCEDAFECKYLFYEIDEDSSFDQWLVTKITKEQYFNMVDQKISLQSSFLNNKDKLNKIYVIKKEFIEGQTDLVTCKIASQDFINLLPKNDIFAKRPKMSQESPQAQTLVAARDNNATVLDLKFYKNTKTHSLPLEIMCDLCNNVKSMFQNIRGKRNDGQLRVLTAEGSCVVRFIFQDKINLLNDATSQNNVEIINEIFREKSFAQSLHKIRKKKEFISAYSKFLKTLLDADTNVDVVSAVANSNQIVNVNLPRNLIKEHYTEFERYFTTTHTYIDNVFGELIAWDTKTKSFKFLVLKTCDGLEKGEIIKGKFGSEIDESQTVFVPKTYNVKLGKSTTIDKSNYTTKNTYTLEKLENSNNL